MKKLICILIICTLAGCKKDKGDTSELGISQTKWNTYKAGIHNNYSYIAYSYVTFGINPTYNETKITVRNGVVVGREYASHGISMPNGTPQYAFTETKETLGSHPEGGEILTIDDIYTKAKDVWLKPAGSILEIDNNGIISRCGYTNTSPYDNFIGIQIKSITPL